MDLYVKVAEAYGSEVFDVLYPSHNTMGDDISRKATINLMKELAEDSDEINDLPKAGFTGQFHWRNYVLLWNYPHKWAQLYRKVTVRASRKLVEKV